MILMYTASHDEPNLLATGHNVLMEKSITTYLSKCRILQWKKLDRLQIKDT